eukprot:g4669.t1
MVQLLFVPALSGSSDTVGRRTVIYLALALHAGSVFALAAVVNDESLAWVSACRLVTSVCVVILPVSQAVMIDLSDDGGRDATHGLGIAFGAFALGNSAGDIVGGSLAEHHRGVACLVSGALASAALLSLTVFGWKETAPSLQKGPLRRRRWWRRCLCCRCWCCCAERNEEEWDRGGGGGARSGASREGTRSHDAESSGGGDVTASGNGDHWAGDGGGEHRRCSTGKGGGAGLLNPLRVLTFFLESRMLLRIACCYFLFVLSLNVFASGYNYIDYRFHWTPPEISYFFATYNIAMALAGGWAIRGIVPGRLSEENGALLGISVQVCAVTLSGLCFRGWMLYPTLVFGALQNITEPCLQVVMATFVGADRQGGLQGAVMSLRVVGEGFAAPLFTQVFSAGSSAGFEQAPFFLATAISLVSLMVAWLPLRKLDKTRKTVLADGSVLAPAAEGWGASGGGGRGGDTSPPPASADKPRDDDDDNSAGDSGLPSSRGGAPPVYEGGGDDVLAAKSSSLPGPAVGEPTRQEARAEAGAQEQEQEAMGSGEGDEEALTVPLLA